ncbi:MAG: tetratricopeptide repeat protein [Acetobacteraceae bacterium]|nr:tetratricopeptide repeat protein [Acetobacteraceae bacterium]
MSVEQVTFLCNRAISLAEDHCLDEARAVLLQAEGLLPGEDRRPRGLVKAAWCRFFDLAGDRRTAARYGREAIRLLEGHGTVEEAAAAVIYVGSVLNNQGKYLQALNLFNRALTLLRGSSDERLAVLARWGLGASLGFLERYQEARESLLAAVARSHHLLSLVERGRLQESAGLACLYCGEFARAEAFFSLALRAFETAGRIDLIADARNCMGSLQVSAGKWDAARGHYLFTVGLLKEQPLPQLAEAHYELSRLEIMAGNVTQAVRHALTALKVARRVDSDLEVARSMLALGQALMGLEKYEAAVPYLERALAVFRRLHLKPSAVVAEDMLKQAERRCRPCAASASSAVSS